MMTMTIMAMMTMTTVTSMLTMHYAEVEKLGLKWLTLTTRFSAHFCTEGAKYLTGMSKLPKNLKKIEK